jgi:hypothetical protein
MPEGVFEGVVLITGVMAAVGKATVAQAPAERSPRGSPNSACGDGCRRAHCT